MKKFKVFILTIFFLSINSSLFAYAGSTAASFLKIGTGARNLSMAGVGAVSRDVNAIYYNPSGLCFVEEQQFTFMHLKWFQDINYQNLSYAACPIGEHHFGASINYLSMDEIEKYDVNDNPLGSTYSPFDFSATFAYATPLREDFFVGANLKFISSQIDDTNAWTISEDLGATYTGFEKFTLGASIQNIGGSLKYVAEEEKLPLNLKVGAEYVWEYNDKIKPKFYMDINQSTELDPYINVAGEMDFKPSDNDKMSYSLRLGYRTRDRYSSGVGFSAGAGIVFDNMGLDFAWAPYGELGETYGVSLNFKLGVCKDKPKKKERPREEVLEKKKEKKEKTKPASVVSLNLSGKAETASSIRWKWNKISSASGYRIYDGKTDKLLAEFSDNKTSWLELKLEPEMEYSRYIKAYYAQGTAREKSSKKISVKTSVKKWKFF
ncbi:PorV/PorQ family protein [Elusimicrobiota bacterium]